MTSTAHEHEHGSLSEEAARLAEAFGQVASGWSQGASGEAPPTGDGDEPAGAPSACRACPLCQVIARVQDVRPEVMAHLVDATSSLADALSELAGRQPAEPQRRERERDDLEHIDISD